MTRWHAVVLLCGLSACSAIDTSIDPAELSLRDLLGMSPELAADWSASERAAARGVIEARLDDGAGAVAVPLGPGRTDLASVVSSLESYDRLRDGRGRDAVPLARADLDGFDVIVSPVGMAGLAPDEGADAALELARWDRPVLAELARTRRRVLVALARASGGTADGLRVEPAEQVGFGAARVSDPPVLLVNPVLLAAAEPDADGDVRAVAMSGARAAVPAVVSAVRAAAAGNPYSFYGSVAECAAAERLRCESCLPSSTCDAESRDAADGNAECTTLSAADGVGYFLFCVNLALAIRTVESCAGDAVPGCSAVSTASNQLAALDANRNFVDDPVCRDGLDSCLSTLYGDPADDYPGPPSDAGPSPEPPPARDPSASCGGSDTNCDFSPQCSPSCGDPDCSNTIDCSSSCDDSSSGSSGGCGSCSNDSSSSGSGCDSGCGGSSTDSSGCGSCSNNSSSGGGCGSCSNDSSSGGGCGSCSNDSSSGGGCGGSSSSSCNASGATARQTAATAVAVIWAMFPLPLLMWLRRRERRRGRDRESDPGGEA